MLNVWKSVQVACLFAVLAVPLLTMKNPVFAVDFDPFMSTSEDLQSKAVEPFRGPVIPQIQFNNNDISMAFQIISDATGWSIFPTSEVSRAKISLWAKDITAGELLDTVVSMAGYLYHRSEGDVITVMTYNEYMEYFGLAKKMVPLKYADGGSLTAIVTPFLTKQAKIVVHMETNTIVLFEVDANLDFVVNIIKELDIPDNDVSIEVIDLEYADAQVLSETLSKVFSGKKQSSTKYTPTQTSGDRSKQVSAKGITTGRSMVGTEVAVEVFSIGRTNQLIVKGLKWDVERVRALITKLDTYMESTTRNYHLTYVDAKEVFSGLYQTLGITGGSGSQQRGNVGGQRERRRLAGLTLLEKTNSIVFTGPPSLHRIMTSVVASVDVPAPYEAGIIRVYKLENADVDEVAATVRELLNRGEEEKRRTEEASFVEEASSDGPSPGTTTGSEDFSQTGKFTYRAEPRVSVSKSKNSIIVQATIRQHRELAKLIKKLDERRMQVLIKALIVEITTTDDKDFGVELSHIFLDGFAFTSFGLSTDLDPVTGIRDIIVSPGGSEALLDTDKIAGLVNALESQGNIKITSAPQILVNNNAVGFINAIDEEPTTQTNQGETTTTTSFAGFVEAGTQFAITPHISENDYLRVQYEITLNSFDATAGHADPSIPPPRSTTSIKSEATVPDGFTIVVGGLQTSSESESVAKVPILGDIPIIDILFKNTSIKKTYKTTYLFITPTIMKSQDFADLKEISQQALEEIEEEDDSQETPEVVEQSLRK